MDDYVVHMSQIRGSESETSVRPPEELRRRFHDPSGERHSSTIWTVGDDVTGSALGSHVPPSGVGLPAWQKRRIEKKEQRDIFLLLRNCIEILDGALMAEEVGNTFSRLNSLSQFAENLSELWRLSGAREENFATVVNMLQMLMADVAYESMTSELTDVVVSIVAGMAQSHYISDGDIREFTRRLQAVGFDPFKALL